MLHVSILGFIVTAWKVSKYGVFSGPYFPVFGLNTVIYGLNLRIQSEYWKIRTRKNFVFGHVLRNEFCQSIRSIWKNEASKWPILRVGDNDETNSLFAIGIIKGEIKSTKEKGKYLQYFDDFIATSSSCKFFTLVTSFYKTRYIGSLFIMYFLSFRKTFG